MDAHELHIQLDPAKRASDDIYEQLRALITSGALKPGDRICTIGGIYGTVTAVKGDVVFVSVGPDKVRLVFTKQAIASIEDSPVEATLDGEIVDSSEKR